MTTNTTNPSVLRALAARCVREKPSAELNEAIALATGVECGELIPAYTTSIDAALTLRLDWMSVQINTGGEMGDATYVEVFVSDNIHWSDAQADTPAASVCAALLWGHADANEWAAHYFQPRAALADGDA